VHDKARKPILAVRDLQTHFFQTEGIVQAVEDATFDVYRGQSVGIVGESGCGKTVTAKSILRIVEEPGRVVGGQIILRHRGDDGQEIVQDLTELPPKGKEIRAIRGREIALIFQEPMSSLCVVYTIGNQIIEAIRLHQDVSKAEAHEKAVELLSMVGIPRPERAVDRYPFELSGGLRQRVMIAMALSCDPSILIADEPTTALDVTTQAQILDLLRDLQAEREMSILLITHDMGVIAEMCDEVVVMYLGNVVESGPAVEIFHDPLHPYTRALLRSIPSVLSKPRTKLPAISGSIPHPYARPAGCSFHPRCQNFQRGRCDRGKPDLQEVAEGRRVRCFEYSGEHNDV
jgi:peptide/nickel transport system ATP-binding protein